MDNSTNGSNKNGLTNATQTTLAAPIYGKCSPNINQTLNTNNLNQTDQQDLIASSPDQQYSFCSLCYDYSLMNGTGGNQLNGQINNPTINNSINNSLTSQLNTVPTNATTPIYNQPISLLDTTQIPNPNSLQNHGQLSHQTSSLQHSQTTATSSPQSNSSTPLCSTNNFNLNSTFNSPVIANRHFNLDNLLNNQNNLVLKAAKSKLNLPINYNNYNGQANQFPLNNNQVKLSPNKHTYQTTNYTNGGTSLTNGHLNQTNLISLMTNSKANSLHQLKTELNTKHKRTSSYEDQPNKKLIIRNTTTSTQNNLTNSANKNKAKSTHSNHYQDVCHPSHLHSNQTINYELNEKVRKDKYSPNLTTPFNNVSINEKINNCSIKRKENFKLNDKNRSSSGEQILTNSFHKKFDEIKSSKSVDSPVTSSSPISEHYDFSSEESEMNLPTNSTNFTKSNCSNQYTNNQQINGNKKLIKTDEFVISKNGHHKSQQNNLTLMNNYQTKNYKQKEFQNNKEAYRRSINPINNSNASLIHKSKESLEPIKRVNNKELSKEISSKLINNSKKKLIQEDDRDDGYVGDELDYRVYNVQQQQQLQSQQQTEDLFNKRITKLNSIQKYQNNNNKKIPFSSSQSEFKSQNLVSSKQTKSIDNLIINSKKQNDQPEQQKRKKDELVNTRKDNDLIVKDDLSKEIIKINQKEDTNSVKSVSNLASKKDNLADNKLTSDVQEVEQSLQSKKDDQQLKNTKSTDKPLSSSFIKANSIKKDAEVKKEILELKNAEEKKESKEIDDHFKDEMNQIEKIEQIKENSSQQKETDQQQVEESTNQEKIKPVNLKQNSMPIVYAFNLVETQVTNSLVRLKWTKNHGVSLTNLERPNYQIEMICLRKEENGQMIKCSRIVQQCSQKSCKVTNLNSEQDYTFRVRLVYEEQLYLSNDLTVTTLSNDKITKKTKPKKELSLKEQQTNHELNRPLNDQQTAQSRNTRTQNLIELKLIFDGLRSKLDFIGKEKLYALIYLFIFFTLCYLFAIICYNCVDSYIH